MTHAGAVLRVQRNGQPPASNPYLSNKDALAQLWSVGHRNPQGIVYDSATDRLWSIEHGPRGGDEINLIQPGHNYGWPIVSHGKEYWGPVAVGEGKEKQGMTSPVKVYIPSIAPSSLLLYTGNAFPQWRGNLFAGALKLTHLNRIIIDDDGMLGEERLLTQMGSRIRSLAQGPLGYIYFGTDAGKIYRIRPAR